MRKYFLLSAVALMVATNVNAATDYATGTLETKANIIHHTKISCDALDFGTIAVPENNGEGTIKLLPEDGGELYTTGDILHLNGAKLGHCGGVVFEDGDNYINELTGDVSLRNPDTEDELILTTYYDASYTSLYIGGILEIPANIEIGEYTGSIEIIVIR
ncbi:MAG: hypothetical protein E7016_04375 [Alphaproteobacteria bacterium]|nr:hypothetical protein [Alphaproteobacteria bacterium]